MLKGIDISQRVEFSCVDDVDPKTVFVLRPLSGLQMIDVAKNMTDGKLVLDAEYIQSILEKSIVEVKNPDIKDKKKIEEYISSLDSGTLTELVVEIGGINNMTGDEQKN